MKKSDSEEVLWSKNFIIILAGSFLMFFAFFLLMPILPMFLKEQFDADKSTIGFALFVYSVMALIIRPFAGYMVDNFSRYKLLLFAYACFVVFFGLYLLVGSVFSFILVRAFHGLFYGLVTISNSTVAIDTMPASRRGEGIGFYGVMSSLAMAFGPTVSLSLYDFFHNYDAIFAIALLSGTLGFLCLFFLKLEKHKVKDVQKEPISFDRFFLLKGTPLAISLLCSTFAYGLLTTYVAVYGMMEVGITKGAGVFFMLLALGIFSSRVGSGKLLDKGYASKIILAGTSLVIIGLFIFVFFKNIYGYYMAAIILGLAYGVIGPAFQLMFINLAPNNQRGTANSSYFITWDLGIGLGALIGGNIAAISSYSDSYLISLFLVLGGLIWFKLFAEKYFRSHKLR